MPALFNDIDSMQARIDAKLERKASTGPAAPESTDATMHRQLTPGSIAAAEERLGEMSPLKAAAVARAMTRAREADSAGDKSACERALAEAHAHRSLDTAGPSGRFFRRLLRVRRR